MQRLQTNSPDDTMPESYKIRRAGDINKYMANGKSYYIFPGASSWRGKNHKQDFIDHIKALSKILDKNGNPLFFDVKLYHMHKLWRAIAKRCAILRKLRDWR